MTPGKRVPTGELWGGDPARRVRALTERERAYIAESPGCYVAAAAETGGPASEGY